MELVRKQVGIEKVHETGYFGKDIGIAVLDTGIMRHSDFDNRIEAFKDFVHYKNYLYDDCGHGTHVCGIAAGNGIASEGKYCGAAPQAKLIVGKVLDEDGNGEISQMIEGIEWVIANKKIYNIRILNISVGANNKEEDTEEHDEMDEKLVQIVERAWQENILVVTAAGNGGPKPMSISLIGAGNQAISVGCHDGDIKRKSKVSCEEYSARGPSRFCIKKPDIVAPGTQIISCCHKIEKGNKGYRKAYTSKSGTSMATPIISGALALLLEKENLTNEEAKRRLLLSAKDLSEPWAKQGWGMLQTDRMLFY